eukprot:4281068-Pyramimonas_sp.AAC.1
MLRAMMCYTMLSCAMLCYAKLCYAMLCCAMLCYAMICHAALCSAKLCYDVRCYAKLRCAMICGGMLCYAMLCYSMLRYVMLMQRCAMLSYAKLRCDRQRYAEGAQLGEQRRGDWGNRPGRATLPGPSKIESKSPSRQNLGREQLTTHNSLITNH